MLKQASKLMFSVQKNLWKNSVSKMSEDNNIDAINLKHQLGVLLCELDKNKS